MTTAIVDEAAIAAQAWQNVSKSAPKAATGSKPSPLTATDVYDLIAANLKDPEPIISPLIFEADLMMIYGWRGVGKTWFSLGLAYAIASGGMFLTWTCTRPRRVLVLDGEMRAARLKKRLSLIIAGSDSEAEKGYLRILTRDMVPHAVEWPDIGRPDGREALGVLIEAEQPDVIIVDNLSAWLRSGKGENDEESWRDCASWLLQQRAKGRAVVLIHHAGKDSTKGARGWSGLRAAADTEIEIVRLKHDRVAILTGLSAGDRQWAILGWRCRMHDRRRRRGAGSAFRTPPQQPRGSRGPRCSSQPVSLNRVISRRETA